jgi:O-antigen ligase
MSYLFNEGDWTVITFVLEAVYVCVVAIIMAGCPDRRLLRAIASIFSVVCGGFLLYVDRTGDYIWGRLFANGIESNFWGLMGVGVVVCSFAHRSRILGIACAFAGCITIYEASSRSSMVGVLGAALLIGTCYAISLRNRSLVIAVGIAAAALLAVISFAPYLRHVVPDFVSDLLKLDDTYRGLGQGFSGRDTLWAMALDLWWRSPWFGVGYRQHELFLPLGYSTHNAYLAMLADIGVFGFLWYLYLLVSSLTACFTIADRRTRNLALASITSYILIGFFERRAINAGNPVSILFLVLCFFALAQRDLARVRGRLSASGSPPTPMSAGAAYSLEA